MDNKSEIYKEIHALRQSIKTAEIIFNNTTDKDLCEACIYDIKALTKKHAYYLKLLRETVAQTTCI